MSGWTNTTLNFTLWLHLAPRFLMKRQLLLPWVFWENDCCLPPDTVKLAAFWCGARPINKALSRSGTLAHLKSMEPTPWHDGVTSSHTAEPALSRPVWKARTCQAVAASDKTETLSMIECYDFSSSSLLHFFFHSELCWTWTTCITKGIRNFEVVFKPKVNHL